MSEGLLKYPQWQEAYFAAMLDMNPVTMKSRVSAAQAAIQKRVVSVSDKLDSEEQEAISDALSNLRVLSHA